MNCKQFSLWARVSVSNNFRGLGFRCIGCKTLVLDNSDLKKQPHTKPSPKKLKLSCVIWVSRWCQPWSTQVVGASACSLHQPCCPGSVTAAYWPPMWPCSTLHCSLSLRFMILKINFFGTRNAYELHYLEFYNIHLVTWTLSYIYLYTHC